MSQTVSVVFTLVEQWTGLFQQLKGAKLTAGARPDSSFKSLYVHISFIDDGELSPALAAPECTFIEDEIP